MDIDQLKALVRDVPDFPQDGVVFKDITPLLANEIAFSTVIDLIVVHFGRGNVDKVVGIEARGFIIASPVAYHFGAGFVPVRKKDKLPWHTEGAEYALHDVGGKVVGVACLIELAFLKGRSRLEGYDLFTLLSY